MIIETARSWLETPYKHQANKKHIGCDCIGLVQGVLIERGIISDNQIIPDLKGYSRVASDFSLINKLEKFFQETSFEEAKSGDIFVMRFRKYPQHVGFLNFSKDQNSNSQNTIIHCYQQVGKVVEHRLDKKWQNRIIAVFRV